MDSLLIVSFSRLEQDARLLRQIALFAGRYRVITAGFGPAVPGADEHIEIPLPPAGRRRRLRAHLEAILLRAKAYRVMTATDPLHRSAHRRLHHLRPNRVIANDINTLPLALSLADDSRVHADLHEFYPGLHDDVPAWVRLRRPYLEWLIRTYARRAASVTTVGAGLRDAYRPYGIDAAVVTNAPAFVDRSPRPPSSPVRIVHAGAALPTRRIERMMRAVAASSAEVVLTVYLTPNNPAYLAKLRDLAATLGDRVRFEAPVPHGELLDMLSTHDVGIHVLPPTVTNQALALPNKFFDFVQARLGVIVGPTPGMAGLVTDYHLGLITDGFEEDEIRRAIDEVSSARVVEWKSAADKAARPLSAERQLDAWVRAVTALGPSPAR